MDGFPRRRGTRLAIESLESKDLMSLNVLGAIHTLPAMLISPLQQSASHHLTGLVTGHFKTEAAAPDTGHATMLSGGGRLSPLGHVQVTGSLHSLGFIATGNATGTLTLATSRGTLTLFLTGPTQSGFSSLPSQFQYTSTSGTGAFANVTASGTVTLVTIATGHGGHGGSSGAGMLNQGRFVMSFA